MCIRRIQVIKLVVTCMSGMHACCQTHAVTSLIQAGAAKLAGWAVLLCDAVNGMHIYARTVQAANSRESSMLRKTKLHDIFQRHILYSSELIWSWLSLTLHWEVTHSGLTNVGICQS